MAALARSVTAGAFAGIAATVAMSAVLLAGVWLLNYGMLAPALGLLPPAPHDDTGRQLTNAAAHALYGASLVAAVERWDH